MIICFWSSFIDSEASFLLLFGVEDWFECFCLVSGVGKPDDCDCGLLALEEVCEERCGSVSGT